MKFESLNPEIPRALTVINAKTVQIRKVLSIKDLLDLKKNFLNLKKTFLIGEKLYVENK
jgi:hypothetical protein